MILALWTATIPYLITSALMKSGSMLSANAEEKVEQDLLKSLANEASRIEEDALYSARSHFEAARGWSRLHYWLGVPTVVLAAVAGASAVAENTSTAAALGILVAVLSALSTFLNPSDRSHQHHAAGTRFNEVRNRVRVFGEIEMKTPGTGPAVLVDTIKELGQQRDELNKASPQIPRWAFERGRKSIQAGEAGYSADRGDAAK
jgi:hypothetical protein